MLDEDPMIVIPGGGACAFPPEDRAPRPEKAWGGEERGVVSLDLQRRRQDLAVTHQRAPQGIP
jgi:hypothetical protein